MNKYSLSVVTPGYFIFQSKFSMLPLQLAITTKLTFLTEFLMELLIFKDKFLWIAEILYQSK